MATFYHESDYKTCRKYLQKQSEESCYTCDGRTTFFKSTFFIFCSTMIPLEIRRQIDNIKI